MSIGEKTKSLWKDKNYREMMINSQKGHRKSPNAYSFSKGHPHYPFRKVEHGKDFTGQFQSKDGYVWIYYGDGHPKQQSKEKKYVKRCVLVMENKIGRKLKNEEVVAP